MRIGRKYLACMILVAMLISVVGCGSGTGPQKAGEGTAAAGKAPPGWVAVKTSELGEHVLGIAFLNGKFYAWGGPRITASSDGLKWTVLYENKDGWIISNLTHGDAGFLASAGKRMEKNNWQSMWLSSTDGKTWTSMGSPRGAAFLSYGGGRYVKDDGYSTDGIRWSPFIGQDRPSAQVSFDKGRFWGVDNCYLLSSADAIQWKHERSIDMCSGEQESVVAVNGVVLVVLNSFMSHDKPRVATVSLSTDGNTWNETKVPGLILDVIYGDGRFLALDAAPGEGNYKNPHLLASKDGLTWSTIATLPPIGGGYRIAEGNGRIVVLGENVAYVYKQ